MCFVKVPHPLGMIPLDEVNAKADAAVDDILNAAVNWKPSAGETIAAQKPYPAPRFKFKGTYAGVNALFYKRGWSLSLPIIPPTPDKVAEMLKGTTHDPAEVLWVVPPRQGMLTVELVAALGVMAGAQPEHMPLLIAAVKAMATPEAAWRGTSTTTAATMPLFVISGPIIKKLGLNPGTGTAGGENPVTNALGYFVNLVGDVVGGSVPPDNDKSTQGTSADLVATVMCENAEATPWPTTFAEDMGFTREDSVITLSTSYPVNGNIDHNSVSSEEILNTFSAGIAATSSGVTSCLTTYDRPNGVHYVLALVGPEHAVTISRDLKAKKEAAEYIVKNAGLMLKQYHPNGCKVHPGYGDDPSTFIPRFTQPEQVMFIVVGGPGKQSQFWTPFPQVVKPVSVKIGGF